MPELVNYNNMVAFHQALNDDQDFVKVRAGLLYDTADALREKKGWPTDIDVVYATDAQHPEAGWSWYDYNNEAPTGNQFIQPYYFADTIRSIKPDRLAKQGVKFFWGTGNKLSSTDTGSSNRYVNAYIDKPFDLLTADQIIYMALMHVSGFNNFSAWYSYEVGNNFVTLSQAQPAGTFSSLTYFGLSTNTYFNPQGRANYWTGNPTSSTNLPVIDITSLFTYDTTTQKWNWKTFDGNIAPRLIYSTPDMQTISTVSSPSASSNSALRWFVIYQT